MGVIVSLEQIFSFSFGKFDSESTYFFYIICNFSLEEFFIQEEELSEVQWFRVSYVINMIKRHNNKIVYRDDKLELFFALEEFVNHYIL